MLLTFKERYEAIHSPGRLFTGMSEHERLGTWGPEQAPIPRAALACTQLPKNVRGSFGKIPMLFCRSPGVKSAPHSTPCAAGFPGGS